MAQARFFQIMLAGLVVATLASGGVMSTLAVQALASDGIHAAER
jgi:hypothetical protein